MVKQPPRWVAAPAGKYYVVRWSEGTLPPPAKGYPPAHVVHSSFDRGRNNDGKRNAERKARELNAKRVRPESIMGAVTPATGTGVRLPEGVENGTRPTT